MQPVLTRARSWAFAAGRRSAPAPTLLAPAPRPTTAAPGNARPRRVCIQAGLVLAGLLLAGCAEIRKFQQNRTLDRSNAPSVSSETAETSSAPIAVPDPTARATWPVLRGATLKMTVEIWAKHSVCTNAPLRNWTVIWKARSAYAIEAPHDMPGNLGFADAANLLLSTYSKFASPPIDWTIWTGNCAVVVHDRPEGEGNDAR
jgi:hypothetical protein